MTGTVFQPAPRNCSISKDATRSSENRIKKTIQSFNNMSKCGPF